MFSKSFPITIEQIGDFFRYREVCKISGESNGEAKFGNSIHIYNDYIHFPSREKWAFVSIENGNIKYQYTENGKYYYKNDCPITTDRNEISLISNILHYWYKKFGLPKSITEFKGGESDIIINEIEINIFNDNAVLRLLNDGTTYLLFNNFPPKKICFQNIK